MIFILKEGAEKFNITKEKEKNLLNENGEKNDY